MKFLDKNYFLSNKTAQNIFHNHIADLPIIDYHTHLPEEEILQDKTFENLYEVWLKHDHYKWRLMRGCGVSEKYITGNASDYEKFEKFAEILPLAIQNPVTHWAHLELQRVFNIDLLINKDNAKTIWLETEKKLKNNPTLSVKNILKKFKVELVCTTDDPNKTLDIHREISHNKQIELKVLPTFRPDNIFRIYEPTEFKKIINDLAKISKINIIDIKSLLKALSQRHQVFHDNNCRLSDHGIAYCPKSPANLTSAEETFQKTLNNKNITEQEFDTYSATILTHIAELNTQKQWTMQLHLGPIRNNSSRYFEQIGRDSGFDSMGDWNQSNKLINFLNNLEKNKTLPKTIVYNLNPRDSEALCCAIQSFQTNSSQAGYIQYGAAWWHLDHKRGMNEHLNILSSLGVLGSFVGMLTDSRSFTSYVRHEYFRRILCDFIGQGIERGEIPYNQTTINIVKNISYYNAKNYFKFN